MYCVKCEGHNGVLYSANKEAKNQKENRRIYISQTNQVISFWKSIWWCSLLAYYTSLDFSQALVKTTEKLQRSLTIQKNINGCCSCCELVREPSPSVLRVIEALAPLEDTLHKNASHQKKRQQRFRTLTLDQDHDPTTPKRKGKSKTL